MAITPELRGVVSACVRAVFRDSARQIMSNEARMSYSLPSTVKWEELVRVEGSLREQALRVCIMSKGDAIHLVFIQSSDIQPLYAPPKLVLRAIRAMLRESLKELSEEQRTAMLSLTMRVQGLRSTDGGVMTEGVSFKTSADSVTLVCRFGANRLVDLSRVARIFASSSVDGLITVSSSADLETRGGLSAEGIVCCKAGLLPLVLYARVPHESLRAAAPITGKRASPVEDGEKKVVRKRGFFSVFGL